MPNRGHLARLEQVWVEPAIFFITTCTADRRSELATAPMHDICREVWRNAELLYGWTVGRYVLMPDHAHFFCAPRGKTAARATDAANANRGRTVAGLCEAGAAESASVELFIGTWKEWTAKYARRRLSMVVPLWQEEFFDHVLRAQESYEEKWKYVRENPVRAKLVGAPDDWPFQGELHPLRYEP